MDKVIKEFKINNYTYQLGYNLYNNKIYPYIEIYRYGELLSCGGLSYGSSAGSFSFFANYSSSYSTSHFTTIKEMLIWLRQYSNIPEYIEIEFEGLFILYKLNDFNES